MKMKKLTSVLLVAACALIVHVADQETKRTAPRAVHHQKQQRLSILTLQMKSMHSE